MPSNICIKKQHLSYKELNFSGLCMFCNTFSNKTFGIDSTNHVCTSCQSYEALLKKKEVIIFTLKSFFYSKIIMGDRRISFHEFQQIEKEIVEYNKPYSNIAYKNDNLCYYLFSCDQNNQSILKNIIHAFAFLEKVKKTQELNDAIHFLESEIVQIRKQTNSNSKNFVINPDINFKFNEKNILHLSLNRNSLEKKLNQSFGFFLNA